MVGYSGGGYRLWDPLKDKNVSLRDFTFNESKVGIGNDMARYQGINIEEENEHLKGKDSIESSEESDKEFIHFEDPAKENNKRNKPNRTLKKPSHLQEYELKWEIQQLNIPTAFLNGYVDDDIYIKTPDGVQNEQGKVLKLKRSLYGLRSAHRKWNERFQRSRAFE
ncbi:hypothetical protein PR048_021467 [Dryococelus australis]|uniref:Reverse transcriptase Ty1/copia-type domain-containing protein n=1 Tax=Dryococelus australis TaxID=614101 RepID=A0ABQ9GYC3_9NEOP|nr:hypothetical protein PR048_021467 [Dryococelus australis]